MTVANNVFQVEAGSSVAITAVANGDTTGKGVTWSLSPTTGMLTNMTGSSVTYNAPATPPPSDVLVTITATSVADPTKSNNVSLTVPAIFVNVTASVNLVQACPIQPCPAGTSQITAVVSNDPANAGVDPASWTITSPAPAVGTLSKRTSTSVTYTAPAATPPSDVQVVIAATSASDRTKSNSVGITFKAIAVSLSANPTLVQACPTLPCPAGMSTITATVSFDPANKGVDPASWTITSPAPAVGALSSPTSTTVTYTAPAAPPPSDVQVTISAKSASDPTQSGPVTITFKAIVVSVSPNPATVAEDTTPPFTATVSFDPFNKGVTWTLTQGTPPSACTPTCGSVSPASSLSGTPITYNAPSAVPNPATVTLTAISVADTTKSGSSTITVANPDAALNGHYAFLFSGFDDATGKQLAVAGSFTADGFGNITNGEEDINGPSGAHTSVTFTGTYIIGLDNRGTATFANSLGGNVTYALALGSFNAGVASKARLIEFDDTTGATGTRGSGFVRLQDPTAFALAKITGPYGFGISGQDSTAGRIAISGIFSADGAGNITTGTEDSNDAGVVKNSVSFTGSYSAPDATNGRATGKISTSSPSQTTNFSLYVVSASEALMITTDPESTSGLESGSVLSQVSTPYTNSSLNAGSVFYEVGVKGTSPATQSDVRIGLFTANGSGSLTILSDENDGGAITADNTTSGLTYSVASNGRVTITGGSGSQPILYLVDTNKAFFLGADGNVGSGFLEPQSGEPFTAFSLSGNFFFGVAPPAVTASTVSSGVGRATNFCGYRFFFCRHILGVTQDSSASNGTLTSGGATSSNFAVSPNGRTTMNNAVIYLISPSKFVRIDENTTDVAPTVSIFEK